jgi:hypothetical protein
MGSFWIFRRKMIKCAGYSGYWGMLWLGSRHGPLPEIGVEPEAWRAPAMTGGAVEPVVAPPVMAGAHPEPGTVALTASDV